MSARWLAWLALWTVVCGGAMFAIAYWWQPSPVAGGFLGLGTGVLVLLLTWGSAEL